ncbi:MAG: undecaprenyl-diphosphate phosphatase [Elstera cyanobacteriorum]|nr:undecaprenyl-diphosphate phosphatase [Elstera cyanobacteriorum]MCK6443030.1 undecaprenyl-diphosphate phosphatase [Elstera cyanobacteriorum]
MTVDSVFWQALFLGLIEGLTEFLPVSSTGHLILLGHLIGFEGPPGKIFEIVIQLGAILAIVVLYWRKLFGVLLAAPKDKAAQRFILAILLAFLPAMIIGAGAHGFIKSVLFSPWVVSIALIVGGIVILVIEGLHPKERFTDIADMPPKTALAIGFIQCLAMIPGVSRSGATILGARMMGLDRKTAAEFSFFLAVPTMLAATVYDVYKNRADLSFDGGVVIAVGFLAAFLTALLVVRTAVGFIARHGFTPFAWYRIAVGALMLGVLIAR